MQTSFDTFFGGSKKAALYVRANYAGDNYSSCKFGESKNLTNTVMEQLQRAGNFRDFQNNKATLGGQEVTQGANDLHQDWHDLMTTVGRFHGNLDRIQGMPDGADAYRAAVELRQLKLISK